jgi:RNA polymerase sigma-70 factor (ECF subfamily)
MTRRSDVELLADHVAGSSTAFTELVIRHQDRLWAVALRTVGDPHTAADVVQDALIKAFQRAETFRGEAAVGTWLHRIVATTALDALRSAKRAPLPSSDLPEAVDPSDAIESELNRADVLAALRTLGDDQRAAVVLVDMVGMSVLEAAQTLDVPEGTVKSRCFRARERLAVLLRLRDPAGHCSPLPPTNQAEGNREGGSDVQGSRAAGAISPSKEER